MMVSMSVKRDEGEIDLMGVEREELDKLIPGLKWRECLEDSKVTDVRIGTVTIKFFTL